MFALGRGSQTTSSHLTIVGQRGIPIGMDYGQASARHGSAELGSIHRRGRSPRSERSRDRSDRSGSEQPVLGTVVRSGPAGQQERVEWIDALHDCKTRIKTLEQNNRTLAQKAAEHDNNFKIVADDIAEYKVWMNGVIFSDETSIDSKFRVY